MPHRVRDTPLRPGCLPSTQLRHRRFSAIPCPGISGLNDASRIFQWSACSAGYVEGAHSQSITSTAFIAYQLFVAITATPFLISRIFLTPGIDCALLASYDFRGCPLLGFSLTEAYIMPSIFTSMPNFNSPMTFDRTSRRIIGLPRIRHLDGSRSFALSTGGIFAASAESST